MRGCNAMRDLVALYASGDLDEKERGRVEAHLAECNACRRAVADMRGVVAVAAAARVNVPDDLAARIAERVSRTAVPTPSAQRSFRWSLALGYASAAVVVFAAGVLVGTQLPKMQSYISGVAQPPPRSIARVPPPTAPQAPPAANPQQQAQSTPQVEPAPPSSGPYVTAAAPGSMQAAVPPASAPAARPAGPPPLKAPMPIGDDDLRLAALPQPDLPEPGAPGIVRPGVSPSRGVARWGAIRGRVTCAAADLAGISLRLVRAGDSTLVPGVLAITDKDGAYELRAVPPGAYRVYAYTGDNPPYFNQCSRLTRVMRGEASTADLQLVMVLEAFEPQLDQVVNGGGLVSFRWSACPAADRYELTVSDAESGAEAFATRTVQPAATTAASSFAAGRAYRWRVRAVALDGSVIGASPGAGGQPWTFRVE